MAGAKRNTDSKLARRFISSLAKELVNDSESGFYLAKNTQDIKEALRKSVDSLPSGKLRFSLQLILEQQDKQEAFISAFQNEIRALSAKLDLHGDVLLTPTASGHLFETLSNCVHGKTDFPTYMNDIHMFSHEEIQMLLARNPAPHILWALAAVKFTYADGASGTEASMKLSSADGVSQASPIAASASALLCCLKPWIVDRDASVAMATMAPIVPLIFESLQQSSGDVSNLKTLRGLVKEILSFIVAVNYKENFMKGFAKSDSMQTLPFSALLDGFLVVFKAFGLQSPNIQTETMAITEKLSYMFPLASELIKNNLKPPDVCISLLADIVKSGILLLYMVLEVLIWRLGDKLTKKHIEVLREQVGRIAVNGLAAGQTDLILDILLSDLSSLNNLLDEEEKSLVCVSIFKAVVLNSNGILDKKTNETLPRSRKALEGFVKRISLARKIAIKQGTKCDILENLACYLKVPSRLIDYLRSCKLQTSLLQKEFVNERALIGWLVQLEDTGFQVLFNRIIHPDVTADDQLSPEKVDGGNAKNLSSGDACNQEEHEDLFFVDTTGEEQGQDQAPPATKRSKKSKKRKAKQRDYQRQGRVSPEKVDVGNAKDLSSGDACNQAEHEDLFFVDTTGEEQGQDQDAPRATKRSKKSKKRKAKQILYQRQGHVTKVQDDTNLSEGVSSSSDSDDNQSGVRGNRRNGEECPSPVHGTVDD